VTARRSLLDEVAGLLARRVGDRTLRVAVDGVDGAGKTTFADELVAPLEERGLPVLRASIDGFHNPRRIRYRRGRHSPEGYLLDSFDWAELTASLLAPLGPGGSGRYRSAVFDHRTDSALDAPWRRAPERGVLLLDGIFLHRPELREHWDFSIFLDAPIEVGLERAARRDGSDPDVRSPANRRYVLGQRLYLDACEPASAADLVIRHHDPARPRIVRRARTTGA
jgi:uridine kinase